jgi:hypothetical protein
MRLPARASQLLVLAAETTARKPLPEALKESVNALASLLFLFAFSRVLFSDMQVTGSGSAIGGAVGALGSSVAAGAREYGPSVALGVAISLAANLARTRDGGSGDAGSGGTATGGRLRSSEGKGGSTRAAAAGRGPPWSDENERRSSRRSRARSPRSPPTKPGARGVRGRQGKKKGDGRPSADDVSGRWWRG